MPIYIALCPCVTIHPCKAFQLVTHCFLLLNWSSIYPESVEFSTPPFLILFHRNFKCLFKFVSICLLVHLFLKTCSHDLSMNFLVFVCRTSSLSLQVSSSYRKSFYIHCHTGQYIVHTISALSSSFLTILFVIILLVSGWKVIAYITSKQNVCIFLYKLSI